MISSAGLESVKEIVNVHGFDIIGKKLDNLCLFSDKYTGKKKTIINDSVFLLK